MERLFSPWRSKYIQTFVRGKDDGEECVLCRVIEAGKDDENYIVAREKHAYVIMNLYPYNSGHVMVVPYRHIPSITDLNDGESKEIMGLLQRMVRALEEVSHPDGFNVGSNIGRTAGAGIDKHVHFHIVPRWNGDTNFMPVLGDTKVISEDMQSILMRLREALELPGSPRH
jgi:ATP adenylyltransferase